MPYFVKIGAIKQNVSGLGSRGYHLFRRNKYIIARWGSLQVAPGPKFCWCCKPQEKKYKYRTESDARIALTEFIRLRIEREGYSRLPARGKIS